MPQMSLPLEPVVSINVDLSPRSAFRKSFDLACLIGENTIISKTERVRQYSSIEAMLSDGFKTSDRLYQAALLLFGQNKKPNRICIGTKDAGESPVEAFQACRAANDEWYVGIVCHDLTPETGLAVAEYAQACKPSTLFAYTTNDERVHQKEDNTIPMKAKKKNLRRTIGQYSTKHKDAIAAVIGYAMGSMTGTANSAFTLAYKTEVGVQTENSEGVFSTQQVANVSDANCNVFINRGSYYDVFEKGVMADGTWFDEMIYLDKLVNDAQLSIMDLLYKNSKIAQTEGGMTQIHTAIIEVCEEFRKVGFLATGVWKGKEVLNLKYGDTLPGGYLIQSEPIDEQAQADREARKAPPVYIALKLAGAIQHVVVQVDVNR